MLYRTWLLKVFAPRPLGEMGERNAARFLKRHGYTIISTRYRVHYGEIDIIAVDNETVVFVEVKTRRDASLGRGAEAVDTHRHTRLTNAALAFLKSNGLLECASRYDVIEVVWPQHHKKSTINHLRNAFSAVGKGQMYH